MDFSREYTKHESTKQRISLTRNEVFQIIKYEIAKGSGSCYNGIECSLSDKFGIPYTLSTECKSKLKKIISDLKKRWNDAHRTEKEFLKKNDQWLKCEVLFSNENDDHEGDVRDQEFESRSSTGSAGRPFSRSSFQELSDRTKRRRTEHMRLQYSPEELGYATQMSLRAKGHVNAAKLVKDVTVAGSPLKVSRYKKYLEQNPEETLSGDEAVALMIENNLSKAQYIGIRSVSLGKNCILYPPYNQVLEAKKRCYPSSSEIIVTESSAEINLQSLLNHIAKRLLLVQADVIESLSSDKKCDFQLICKWGCDGTSGQSTFKQKFHDDDGTKTDANMFVTSVVPLQLVFANEIDNNSTVLWKNPRSSSPRFCRPIKLQFLHETAETTRVEVDYIRDQEKKLQPFQTIFNSKQINVSYKIVLTMIDGKVCNSLSHTTSAQRCFLCKCTSKQFNDIDQMLKKKVVKENLEFGISSLHAWIRFFECLLHLSYKLDVKSWQCRKDDKIKVEARKKSIQTGFRQQLGLLVDAPKQGYGSTNDGNTARRFFENSGISASITGIDKNLINRFHVILQVISCGFNINIVKFEEYTLSTARRFVELYPWYYMPTSVHKILIHGSQIIESSLLPIGQMSEEAQESCNKFIKKFRQDFSRKCSRIKTMEDVFRRLLVTSDPFISSLRKLHAKKMRSLSPEAIELLQEPSIEITNVPASSTGEVDCSEADYESD